MKTALSKYKNLFFIEAEEKITSLNSALIKLEQSPKDTEFAEQAMRAAHTLKSSSAAMGFVHISGLTHAMEDFFEKSRTQNYSISKDLFGLLFLCLDTLSESLKLLKNNKSEINTKNLIDKLTKISGHGASRPKKEPDSSPIDFKKKIEKFEPITSIRVDVGVLDSLMTSTEELLVERMRLEQTIKVMAEDKVNIPDDLQRSVENISRLINDLQYNVTATHMVPLGQLFERFPRIVRDLANERKKKVVFETFGQSIELDRVVVDSLSEPIIHLLRNAVDHGIDKIGKVKIEAKRNPDNVELIVYNEGHQIDWDSVIVTAFDRGIIDVKTKENYSKLLHKNNSVLSSDIKNLIFHPHLSTKKNVTETSGRGVGLAIVKSVVESLGGKVSVESGENGTSFLLALPLTIAIVQALLIKVAESTFALPFSQVDKLVRIQSSDVKHAFDQEVMVVDDQNIPLLRLDQKFGLSKEDGIFLSDKKMESFGYQSKSELVIITKTEKYGDGESMGQIGLVVDEVFSEQDIVVKPLQTVLKKSNGFAGVTLLGDGRPALILDIGTLV